VWISHIGDNVKEPLAGLDNGWWLRC